MAVLVFVTRNYHWALKPFALQFNKYWGDEVLLVSEARPGFKLPDNFEWTRVPAYGEAIWPIQYYSNGIISQLELMDDEVVTIMMPDHWLTRPVDRDKVAAFKRYPIERPHVVKAGLKADCSIVHHGQSLETFEGLDVVRCPRGSQHCGLDGGSALALGHWHRERALQVFQPNWSPWQVETMGTERMNREHPDWFSVGTRPGLVDYQDGVRKGQTLVFLDKLNPDDRAEVKALLPGGMELYE